jgi:hypothetical protein
MKQQKHEMILDKTHSSGAEEWNCPSCGRRLLVHWEPTFKKIVLEAGDDFSVHSGGKGGLRMGHTQVSPVNDPASAGTPPTPLEDSRLAPWLAWLDESDFEDLWDDDKE